jgi:two-component system, NtrC family, sensor kinase
MNSLRRKIAFAYYSIGALMLGLSVFVLIELQLIETKVLGGERVAEFVNVTLEIRRFEKNYFLYRQVSDAEENRAYVARAQRLLAENREAFSAFGGEAELNALRIGLQGYAELMAEYLRVPVAATARESELEARVRQAGKDLVTTAESMAAAERKMLQASLARHRISLSVSIVVLIILVVVIGRVLYRMVAGPLKHMEKSMEAVANGNRDQIDIPSADREMVSLTHAFNHVLQELELRQKHLLRSEKLASLGTLLSGVAHELNNPLSNISTSCQILIEEMDSADRNFRRKMLGQIDEQTVRARNIVRSLLDFAREREFSRESLSLQKLVAETLHFIKGQVPAQVHVITEISPSIVIHCDKQRLQQALLNLLNNALAALDGAGEIRIRAQCSHNGKFPLPPVVSNFPVNCIHAGDAVEIAISDNGHGIPAELLPRIFDPFFTTRDVGKGSGLGLYIVHEIVEEHGGCIVAESEPGKGTVFCIRLPLTSGAKQDE